MKKRQYCRILEDLVTRFGVEYFLTTYCNRNTKKLQKSVLILCLWHEEKNPSLAIYCKSGLGKCFACNKKASLISIYAMSKNISFSQALQDLSHRLEG